MSPDDIKKRIVNEIKARAYDDKYIDRNEEREIVLISAELGVTVESALAALNQVCDEFGYVLESRVQKQIEDQLATAAGNDGKIDRREFDLIFGNVKRAMAGKKPDRDIKKMIVRTMDDTGHNKVRTGWFSDWYAALKKELGV
ncbi:hypothetical protein R5W23_002275 [Gemmata sp. JC673]|uniref:DUF3486 family protein n=2 Tax=Gemmata algarum TaxID=2975278 RepID=A0ABU5F0T5_9BACT|nr:hypothetical protein [Gemmata algarum]MDY3561016.1 hypothetical protein [Gemmata algarum]